VKFTPDAGTRQRPALGFGSAAVGIDNSVSVAEEFLEVRVPLIQDRPGIKDLIFDTAYRTSDYSSTGRVNTYKFETQYAPVDSLRVRGSYQRAVRSPTVVELYNGNLVGLIQLGDDPCSSPDNVTPATASLADCLHTVPAASRRRSSRATATAAPPTTSRRRCSASSRSSRAAIRTWKTRWRKSYTVGFNVTPQALPNFTGSIDYYKIEIDKEVGVIAANVALNTCLATAIPPTAR
jgi:hypothetical protein